MRNENYWANRIKIAQDKTLDRIYDEYVANIEKQYDRAIRDIEKDILVWYQRFADNNELSFADAQKLLKSDKLEEFKWTVQEYIEKGKENGISADWAKELENASARVHISRLESLKYQLRAHAEELTQGRIRNTTDAAELAFTEGYYHTAFEFQKEIGVGFALQSIDRVRLEKILNTPWTTDNQTFTARCWTDKAKLVEAVNQEITRMVATGASPKKAIESIAKQFNTSKSNAGKLIMTESAYFATASQGECYKDLDVDNYEVVGTLDSHTCSFCGEMDGKVFPVNKMQAGSTAPPFHPWCRCTTAPYYEDMVGVGKRFARDKDGKTYTVPSDMTYAEWKKKFVDNSAESGIINTDVYYAGLFGKNKKHKGSANKKDFEKVDPKFFETLPRLSSPETPEQAAFKANTKDYSDNCQRSVPVWELRMRGFDVIASKPDSQDDLGFYAQQIFYNANWNSCKTTSPKKEIERFLIEQGHGSRVEIAADIFYSPHMFAAANDNGVVKWVDPLTGETSAEKFFEEFYIDRVSYCRIDNLDLSNLIIKCIE